MPPEVKKLKLEFSIRLPKVRLDEPRIGEKTTLASWARYSSTSRPEGIGSDTDIGIRRPDRGCRGSSIRGGPACGPWDSRKGGWPVATMGVGISGIARPGGPSGWPTHGSLKSSTAKRIS